MGGSEEVFALTRTSLASVTSFLGLAMRFCKEP